MAYPKLTGNMVRLNGVNQYLEGEFPYASWSALFFRIIVVPTAFHRGYICDYTRQTHYLRIRTRQELPVPLITNTSFVTSASNRQTITSIRGLPIPSETCEGPIDLVIAWDGANYALYHNGYRKYIVDCIGTFEGTAYFRIGHSRVVSEYFNGYVGHMILHDVIPAPYAGLPERVYEGHLAATEWLRVHGLTENDILCLWDFRDLSDPGRNYGSGGSAYDLRGYGDPTYHTSNYQYKLINELEAEAWLDCSVAPAYQGSGIFIFHTQGLGGEPPYTYQWFISRDQGGTWEPQGTGPSFTLTQTEPALVWVKCQITDIVGASVETQIIKVMVYPRPPEVNVCEVILSCSHSPAQYPPATFLFHATLNGNPSPLDHLWQWSGDGGITWQDVFGGPSFQFDAGYHNNTPGEYWIRCTIGGLDTSGIVKVRILTLAVGELSIQPPLKAKLQTKRLKARLK